MADTQLGDCFKILESANSFSHDIHCDHSGDGENVVYINFGHNTALAIEPADTPATLMAHLCVWDDSHGLTFDAEIGTCTSPVGMAAMALAWVNEQCAIALRAERELDEASAHMP